MPAAFTWHEPRCQDCLEGELCCVGRGFSPCARCHGLCCSGLPPVFGDANLTWRQRGCLPNCCQAPELGRLPCWHEQSSCSNNRMHARAAPPAAMWEARRRVLSTRPRIALRGVRCRAERGVARAVRAQSRLVMSHRTILLRYFTHTNTHTFTNHIPIYIHVYFNPHEYTLYIYTYVYCQFLLAKD